ARGLSGPFAVERRSAPVKTPTTPGAAAAPVVSMDLILAAGRGLRTIWTWRSPAISRSAVYLVTPATLSAPSSRRWPRPTKLIPIDHRRAGGLRVGGHGPRVDFRAAPRHNDVGVSGGPTRSATPRRRALAPVTAKRTPGRRRVGE